jgi:hypothetical protein
MEEKAPLQEASLAEQGVQISPSVPAGYMSVATNPPHATTESTLAPTSEFTRNFLLALPARYILRGLSKLAFGSSTRGAHVYNASMGVGSLALTLSYNKMVRRDMFNLFSEAVAYESGKNPEDISYSDLQHSENRIVARTVEISRHKTFRRLATDALFFITPLLRLAPPLRSALSKEGPIEALGDAALGIKGLQLFGETWKREPTLFEHVAALVNSKINPKNGLGQPLSIGEVFDLYQHYHFEFTPQKAFHNVLDNNSQEAQIWAGGKVVFDRITELLNLTYSYKHATSVDAATGTPQRDADFALPKFLYLLGHDLIDPTRPEQTMLYIEAANRYGMSAVKQIESGLRAGASLEQMKAQFPVTIDMAYKAKTELAPTGGKIGTRPQADTAEFISPDAVLAPKTESARQHYGNIAPSPIAPHVSVA